MYKFMKVYNSVSVYTVYYSRHTICMYTFMKVYYSISVYITTTEKQCRGKLFNGMEFIVEQVLPGSKILNRIIYLISSRIYPTMLSSEFSRELVL